MKTKFFLCMRPPVIETDDGDYVKLPPTVTRNPSGRRNPGLQRQKRVAPEKFMRQLSIKSDGNRFEGKSETPVPKDCHKCQKPTGPLGSETNVSKTVSLKKPNSTPNSEVSGGGPGSNSGVYLMVSSLIFTIFLGKFFGILCTLMLLYSLFPRRKKGASDDDRGSMDVAAESPEKGSPEEYKKRIIMEGLLERKGHNRESIKFLS